MAEEKRPNTFKQEFDGNEEVECSLKVNSLDFEP